MIRAVIFDLDGTLMDSTDAIVDSWFYTFDLLGIPRPDRQRIIDTIGYPLRKQIPMFTSHDVDECIRIYRGHYTEHSAPKTTLLPGATEMLAAFAARGLRMGFATSKKREAAEMLLDHLDALHYMEARIGPLEVTRHKPDPEPVEKAMAVLGVTPEETVFVGDMHFDILAGQAAGVITLAVTTGYQARPELEALNPDAVYDSLHEVRDHVLGLL
jgi:HAD superfamily hydrolase (TIGR01509 family)